VADDPTADVDLLTERDLDELAPVFIVTAGRSGSTLLRLILDDHPEVGCPGETGLPSLIGHISRVWHTVASDVERAHVEVMSAEVRHHVRLAASAPMRFYLEAEEKRLFCDKSLETAWYLPAILDIFPRARFILLFRHVMDVVASGVAASTWGFSAFGYAQYVSRSVDNFVAPLVDHWTNQTGLALAWEREHEQICHRVRYEDLVVAPTEVLSGIWDFLGVRRDVEIGPGVWDRARRARTPGDMKIAFTDSVHTDSMGSGRRVPVELIPPVLLERMNTRLRDLDYDEVGDDWSARAVPSDTGRAAPEVELSVALLTALLGRVQPLDEAAADAEGPTTFAVVADDRSGLRWVISPEGASADLETAVPVTVTGSAADLVDVLRGRENPGLLLSQRRLRIRVHGQGGRGRTRAEMALLIRRLVSD
jgi:hypothetical protein